MKDKIKNTMREANHEAQSNTQGNTGNSAKDDKRNDSGHGARNAIKKGECILICAGDFSLPELKQREEDYYIAVDGGYAYCGLLGIRPQLIVGDFDSLDRECLDEIGRIEEESPERVMRLVPEKDDTDTLAAVKAGLKLGYKRFCIYAGMGGRLEHTLANIQILLYLKEQGAEGYLMDMECMAFIIREEEMYFRREMEGYLSLFAINGPAEGVTIQNMKYLLDRAEIRETFPVGISNEFIGEPGSVSVRKGSLLAIVRWT